MIVRMRSSGSQTMTRGQIKKNQFIVISSKPLESQNIELHGSVSITSEPSVKILGVVFDDRLNFDEHIRMCCTKAARSMSRNKLRRFGKSYWEENRKMRNYVIKIRKMSLANYLAKHCEKQDKHF